MLRLPAKTPPQNIPYENIMSSAEAAKRKKGKTGARGLAPGPGKRAHSEQKNDNGGDGVDGGGKIKNVLVEPLLLKLYQNESRTNKQNP